VSLINELLNYGPAPVGVGLYEKLRRLIILVRPITP
jgi:hypothetical protein